MDSILEKLNHDESKGKEHDDKKEEGDSFDEEEQPDIPLAGGSVLIGST